MFHVNRDGTLEFSVPRHLNQKSPLCWDDVIQSVKNSLKSEFTQVKCIQASPNGLSYRVTFKDTGKRAKENLLVREVHIKGSFCYLAEAEPKHSVVNISNLPSELQDQKVIGFFAKYGTVSEIRSRSSGT